MCLIAFAWQAHADYPLIVASNRDEFFERPTASAAWWPGHRVLAGRDLRAGGTWMGVCRDGRFAALTNHRDPSAMRPDAPSRGELVGDFLTSGRPADETVRRIASGAGRFNGFNLLCAQWQPGREPIGMWVVESTASSDGRAVASGIHGLSNARLDTSWPKVDDAVARMSDAVTRALDVDDLVESLFAMLGDRTIAADERLPRTGVPLAIERALSASFIRLPGYGTRASTVLVVDRRGRTTFVERRCEPDVATDERRFAFETASEARGP